MLPTYVFVTQAAHLQGFLLYLTTALFFANITAPSWSRLIVKYGKFGGKFKHYKAGYTLIISLVSTCLCTISWTMSWDCEPITIHFSQYLRFRSSLILRETWWETCPIVLFDILWKYWSSGENSETRDEKNDWRDGLWNAICTLLISFFSPTFFPVLVNLTISV